MHTRSPAALVVFVAAVALTGCCSGARPDARVAAAVERGHRKHLAALTAVASADDEGVVVLAGAESSADDEKVAAVEEGGSAPAAEMSPAWLESAVPAFSMNAAANPYGRDAADAAGTRDEPEQKHGLPNLRFELMKFDVRGRPVVVKCTVKGKALVFGAKVKM